MNQYVTKNHLHSIKARKHEGGTNEPGFMESLTNCQANETKMEMGTVKWKTAWNHLLAVKQMMSDWE